MSENDCSRSDYEHRREGERAADRGVARFRNPYDEQGEDDCRRAHESWDTGHRRAELRREEEEHQAQQAEREHYEDAMRGSACGPGCGWCGACS